MEPWDQCNIIIKRLLCESRHLSKIGKYYIMDIIYNSVNNVRLIASSVLLSTILSILQLSYLRCTLYDNPLCTIIPMTPKQNDRTGFHSLTGISTKNSAYAFHVHASQVQDVLTIINHYLSYIYNTSKKIKRF